jgi:hypothetical protein
MRLVSTFLVLSATLVRYWLISRREPSVGRRFGWWRLWQQGQHRLHHGGNEQQSYCDAISKDVSDENAGNNLYRNKSEKSPDGESRMIGKDVDYIENEPERVSKGDAYNYAALAFVVGLCVAFAIFAIAAHH